MALASFSAATCFSLSSSVKLSRLSCDCGMRRAPMIGIIGTSRYRSQASHLGEGVPRLLADFLQSRDNPVHLFTFAQELLHRLFSKSSLGFLLIRTDTPRPVNPIRDSFRFNPLICWAE